MVDTQLTDYQWHYAKLNNINIAYLDNSRQTEQTLIFIHGWCGQSAFWRFQLPAFSDNYRVIAIDLPGGGRSDRPQDITYSLPFFAQVVNAVVQQAKINKPVLIGHSMGYAIIRQYLTQYSGSVKAIVNVDGTYFIVPATTEGKIAFEQRIQSMIDAYKGPHRLQAIEQFLDTTFYGHTPVELQQEIRKKVISADNYAAVSALREFTRLEQWQLQWFDVPCLAIYAESQQLFPNHGEYVKNEFSNLIYEEWSQVGHTLMMEQPQRFNRLLTKFLQRLARNGQMKNRLANQMT